MRSNKGDASLDRHRNIIGVGVSALLALPLLCGLSRTHSWAHGSGLPLVSYKVSSTPASCIDLHSWLVNDFSSSLDAFLGTCVTIEGRRDFSAPVHPAHQGFGTIGQWQRVCQIARERRSFCSSDIPSMETCRQRVARHFFKNYFKTIIVGSPYTSQGEVPEGTIRTSFSPLIQARDHPSEDFSFPLVAWHESLESRYRLWRHLSRTQIIERARSIDSEPVLAWVRARDSFFLSPQHRICIEREDHSYVTLQPNGSNDFPPIGALSLVSKEGWVPAGQRSTHTLLDWLRNHTRAVQNIVDLDPGYTFFTQLEDSKAKDGCTNLDAVPGYSLFVDPRFYPFGMPVWVARYASERNLRTRPEKITGTMADFVSAMSSTASHIDSSGTFSGRLTIVRGESAMARGPHEADIFLGWGDQAEKEAAQSRPDRGMLIAFVPDFTKLGDDREPPSSTKASD